MATPSDPGPRQRAKDEAQAAIERAASDLARGKIDESVWCERVSAALAAAYLSDDDPRWQSGFDGDAEAWRRARELVLDCVDGDGAFLDIGCANGHLMECLAGWGIERGHALAMYGLELDPALARTARRRLPEWAGRIFEGNAIDWKPPMRFTYVRASLEYVPPGRGASLVARLLRDVVAPGGRLIVGPIQPQDLDETLAAVRAAGAGDPAVRGATDRNGKTRYVVCVEQRAV